MFSSCELADSSIALYKGRIEKWLSYLPKKIQDIDFLIIAPERSMYFLQKTLESLGSNTPTNRHCFISSIVALFTHSPESIDHLPETKKLLSEWTALQKENTKVITIRRLQNKPTESQESKGVHEVTWSDVLTTRDSLERCSSEHLLLSFYTYIYPLRADLFSTQIVKAGEKPTEKNYILMKEKSSSLYVQDFKTVKKYGSIVYDPLPSELHTILQESLKKNPREYLFIDSRGNAFSRDGFSKWSNRLLTNALKSSISLSTLRHLFISTLDFNMPAEKLQEIGNKMGHSLSMQKLYQWKEDEE